MRELTIHELDTQLAEQLPARELMGAWKPHNKCGCGGDAGDGGNHNVALQANVLNVNLLGHQDNTNSQDNSGGSVIGF